MDTKDKAAEALRLAEYMRGMVQTYPQMSEDEPGAIARKSISAWIKLSPFFANTPHCFRPSSPSHAWSKLSRPS